MNKINFIFIFFAPSFPTLLRIITTNLKTTHKNAKNNSKYLFLKAMDKRNLTRDYHFHMAIKYENLSCKKQNLSSYKKEINIYKISTLCGFYPFFAFCFI